MRLLIYMIGCWTSPGITSVYIIEANKCESDHGVSRPQKAYFQASIIHYHDPTDFAVSRGGK